MFINLLHLHFVGAERQNHDSTGSKMLWPLLMCIVYVCVRLSIPPSISLPSAFEYICVEIGSGRFCSTRFTQDSIQIDSTLPKMITLSVSSIFGISNDCVQIGCRRTHVEYHTERECVCVYCVDKIQKHKYNFVFAIYSVCFFHFVVIDVVLVVAATTIIDAATDELLRLLVLLSASMLLALARLLALFGANKNSHHFETHRCVKRKIEIFGIFSFFRLLSVAVVAWLFHSVFSVIRFCSSTKMYFALATECLMGCGRWRWSTYLYFPKTLNSCYTWTTSFFFCSLFSITNFNHFYVPVDNNGCKHGATKKKSHLEYFTAISLLHWTSRFTL